MKILTIITFTIFMAAAGFGGYRAGVFIEGIRSERAANATRSAAIAAGCMSVNLIEQHGRQNVSYRWREPQDLRVAINDALPPELLKASR